MKKNIKILIIATFIIIPGILYTTLDQYGISDIRSQQPRKQSSRIKASDDRIVEEIGNPITQESIVAFMQKVASYIELLKNKTVDALQEDNLKVAVKGITDLINAYSKLQDKNDALQEQILTMEKDLRSSFSLGRLHYVLDDMKNKK